MKYPALTSIGSALYPKLLGSYERELHGVIKAFLKKKYTEILDIGCAEGYYAIGLSLKFNDTKVFAYDTDETARKLCLQMAKLNGTEDKLFVKETCTAEELKSFKFSGPALVICDCEGYESSLFTTASVKNLTNCDLLIETHDFIDLNISQNLVSLFNETHNIQIVKSIDDIEKAKTYGYKETDSLSLNEKMILFRECRPSIMEWLVCTPKNNA
ncbi:MAG: 50S ribosomal protein L11 methyltransferase [Bacteroidota bacterium]|nr:50S ribosomal protein L11 methyltransferase [Bacteroidota bacterium]